MAIHPKDEALLRLAQERRLISRRQHQAMLAELETTDTQRAAARLLVDKGFITPEQRVELEDEVARMGEMPVSRPPSRPPTPLPKPVASPPSDIPKPQNLPTPVPSKPQTPLKRQSDEEWTLDTRLPLGAALLVARDGGAADVHWSSAGDMTFRHFDRLQPWKGNPLSRSDVEEGLLTKLSPAETARLVKTGAVVSNALLPDGWRVRFSLLRALRTLSLEARFFPQNPPSLETLGVPPSARIGYDSTDGLFLIAGPQRSGRTTTLQAILLEKTAAHPTHVVRIIRSLDYELSGSGIVTTTWRVGRDVPTLLDGINRVHHMTPGIVAIDDLVTAEECLAALELAGLGVPVLGTICADSILTTCARFVEAGKPEEISTLAVQFSERIRGVLSQRLLPRADTPGLILIPELLLASSQALVILRSARVNQVYTAIHSGRHLGMIGLDQALLEQVNAKTITIDTARQAAINKQAFPVPTRPVSSVQPFLPPPGTPAPGRPSTPPTQL